MTGKQKLVVAYLTIADTYLRKAMVAAGESEMLLVTEAIKESEWYLDEAIAKVGRYPKKVKKVVDKKQKICHNGSRKI